MSDTFLILAVGVIGIGIGFALGMLVNSLRSPQSDSKAQEVPGIQAEGKPKPDLPGKKAPPAQTTQESLSDVQPSQDQSPLKRPSMNPLDAFTRALQPVSQPTHPFARSIAEQVDEILQEMLMDSPLRSRAIRLLELPQKGMVVMVGLDQYAGVDAVPDEEIHSLIRSAVAEWERRVSEDETVNT